MSTDDKRALSWSGRGYKHRFKKERGIDKHVYYNFDEYEDHCYMGWRHFTLGFIELEKDTYIVYKTSTNYKTSNIAPQVIKHCDTLEQAKQALIEEFEYV